MSVSGLLKSAQTNVLQLLALLVFIFGAVLIAQHHIFELQDDGNLFKASGIGESLGIAFITAVILGISIEWVFRQRLLEDVFKASIGYILPDELKDEVRALFEAEFICVSHDQVFTLRFTEDPDAVILHIKTERTFKNVTSSRKKIPLNVSVTEWFHHKTLRSKILNMGCIAAGERITDFKVIAPSQEGINKILGTIQQEITLNPDEECTFWYETEEIKRTTDVYHAIMLTPTKNPRVTAILETGETAKESIRRIVDFGSRHRLNVDVIGEDTVRMNGVLLPYQHIELRWYLDEDYQEWVALVEKSN